VHIINRVPSKSVSETPYELWTGRKPNINYFYVWGYPIETKIFNPQIENLDLNTICCHFIGYPEKSKVYQFYCPNHTTKFTYTRHAAFLECDVSSIPRKIDLEEIRNYIPTPMTHDFIPMIIVAPHVESTITENEDVPIVDEQQVEDFRTNEAPLNNQQEVEPEQPQEEINEPQPIRRSLRERKSVISKDYAI
jgi:hypothetical protein